MKTRHVELIAAPARPHFVGDGFRVHNFIPGQKGMDMRRMDPFIMLDYNSKYEFPPAEIPRGVGAHPHRGFETVTIAYQGKVEHHDSAGGGGVIGQGDIQWMTAASGVLHKEFHETQWSKTGGVFQMVQLWVNLPAKDKMSSPKYQAIADQDKARVSLPNQAGEVEVIAGEFNGHHGPASTFSPMHIYNLKLKAASEVTLELPSHFNTALLVIEGSISINRENQVITDHLALMANDGEEFTVRASSEAVVLVISGEPLNEPIASYGPFVMNTQAELNEAFEDFQQGKFGHLAD